MFIHYFYILPLSLNHCFYTTALCVQVKNWLKAYKKKANITTKVGSNKIDKIQEELGKIERVEDWDGVDMSKPLLFPSVEIPHLSRGEEAAEHTKNPGCTNRGEDFCLASVISSAAMCNQLITQCNTVQFATIRGVDDGGLQLEEINFPFISFDYISSFLASSSLGAFGTVTKNHHGRLLGFQVAHAEQKPTAKEGIESFLAGFRIVQEKQGYDRNDIDQLLDNINFHSDNGDAIKLAVREYTASTHGGTDTSCSAHLHNDGLKKNKAKLKNDKNIGKIRAHIFKLQQFPNHAYGNIPWEAVEQKWMTMNEEAFCKWFKAENIVKNPNFRAGSVAIGAPDDNNALESMNEHQLRKLITAAFRRLNDKARLPMPMADVIRILVEELIPSWSADATKPDCFETDFETTTKQRKLAKEFMLDPFLVELTPNTTWAARFKGKETILMSKETASKAFALHKQAIEAHSRGQSDKVAWSWKDFKLAASVVFISKDSCFPCQVFFRKKMCLHIMAIRELLGEEGLKIGAPEEKDGDEIRRKSRGGNKRKRGQDEYIGIVADRLLETSRNKAKEAIKTRREAKKRKQELKQKKRPRREFKCQCGREVKTLLGLRRHCTYKGHSFPDDEEDDDEGDTEDDGDDDEEEEDEEGGDDEEESN